MRVSYNGKLLSTFGFQPENVGSIPITRSLPNKLPLWRNGLRSSFRSCPSGCEFESH